MDNFDREKITNIIRTREKAHAYYSDNSDVYKAFLAMEAKTFANGKLTKFQKELIAIGISVVINCESCMEWHIKQALDQGGAEADIIEVIGVGIEMAGGPATASARFAMRVLEYYAKKNP